MLIGTRDVLDFENPGPQVLVKAPSCPGWEFLSHVQFLHSCFLSFSVITTYQCYLFCILSSPSLLHCLIQALIISLIQWSNDFLSGLFNPQCHLAPFTLIPDDFSQAKLLQLKSSSGSLVPSGLSLNSLSSMQGLYSTCYCSGLITLNFWHPEWSHMRLCVPRICYHITLIYCFTLLQKSIYPQFHFQSPESPVRQGKESDIFVVLQRKNGKLTPH